MPACCRAAGDHRHARPGGEFGHARGGVAARPARAVRGDGDLPACGEMVEQAPRGGRPAAAARPLRHLETEPPHHFGDQFPVAMAADQHLDAATGEAAQHRHHGEDLVPEGGDGRGAFEIGSGLLEPFATPARGGESKAEIGADEAGEQPAHDRVLSDPPRHGERA